MRDGKLDGEVREEDERDQIALAPEYCNRLLCSIPPSHDLFVSILSS